MANFGCCQSVVKNKLFNQYCCFFYGASLWSVYNYEPICIIWQKALNIIWDVPRQTHGSSFLSDSGPLVVHLKVQFVKFMFKALKYENHVVRYMAKVAYLNPMYISRKNCHDCTTIQNDVSMHMVDMNVMNVYRDEW